jgi:ethanolamine utilization protein EutQ
MGIDRHCQKITIDGDLDWYQRFDQKLFLADALNASSGNQMTVGFARYGAGETMPWKLSYDEVLIILTGRFSLILADQELTAGPGEMIYIPSGAELDYRAEEDTTFAYVTYPHWWEATLATANADKLADFHKA